MFYFGNTVHPPEAIAWALHLLVVMFATIYGGGYAGLLSAFLASLSVDYEYLGEPRTVIDSPTSFAFLFLSCVPVLLLLLGMRSAIRQKQAARETAERNLDSKEALLAVMAHDLRQPLSSASLQLEQALSQILRGNYDRPVDAIRKSLTTLGRMSRLIDDVLDESKISDGRFSIRVESNRLDQIVNQVGECFSVLASRHGFRFSTEIEAREWLPVEVDADRIVRVIENLLGNALKFAPAGSRISLTLTGSGSDFAEIAVRNTGGENVSECSERIFEKKWQGKSSDSRGAGLGLFVSRQIVEAHGGTIQCSKDPDTQEMVFRIRLPLISAHEAQCPINSSVSGLSVAVDPPALREVRKSSD